MNIDKPDSNNPSTNSKKLDLARLNIREILREVMGTNYGDRCVVSRAQLSNSRSDLSLSTAFLTSALT